MKDLIYFPSLSSFSPYLKKDVPLIKDYSHRFYDKAKFGDFHHPYFLLSAGSVYKRKQIRHELGMDDILVFGDSGGFQIATGALKWDVSLRENIFNWLENNSDLAMNIDIPPVSKNYPFSQCMELTVDNMKWFEKHQTGKTDFLNVIQCQTVDQMVRWYDSVKDFNEFKGWGAGNVASFLSLAHLIALFLEKREFEKPNCKWFHFLGKTSVQHFIIYSIIQKKLNEYFPHVQVTTDSSTPAMQAVFGNWYHSANYKNLSFVNLYYGNKGKTNYVFDAKLPCEFGCPMCKEITFDNIANDGGAARFYIAYHNLFLMNKVIENINKVSTAHFEIWEGLVNPKFLKVLRSICEMFDSGKPMEVFNRYAPVYKQFDIQYPVSDKEVLNDEGIFGTDEDEEDTKGIEKKDAMLSALKAGTEINFEQE